MNIEELIKMLCPKGVNFKMLKDVVAYEQPSKYIVDSTNYDNRYSIPVLTAGQTFILGYTDEVCGIYSATKDDPVIIFDDFTTAKQWVDFNFKVKSSAMKILTSKNENVASTRYLFFAMQTIKYVPDAATHSRQWIDKYSKFEIPVPPPPIQQEIVRILDNFSLLTAELQAELQTRKSQYEYYRNQLLSFSHTDDSNCEPNNKVKWMKLEDVCKINRGVRVVRNDLQKVGDYPVYQNSMTPLGYFSEKNCPAKTVFIISAGAAGEIGYSYNDFWAADDCFCLICSNCLISRYLYYVLKNKQRYFFSNVRRASVPRLARQFIERLEIPIPPLSEQARIVSILDRFDKLCNDLSEGLPAEIKARQKQYEYYRNKLLTFKEKA